MRFEREFLKLAGVWLGARWCIMGGDIVDAEDRFVYRGAFDWKEVGGHMLGCIDNAAELRVICQLEKEAHNAHANVANA